jgi:general secretion pathway protein D
MIPRFARLCLAVLVSALAIDAVAQPPVPRPVATPDENVSLRLPDADLDTVLSALEGLTGKMILRPTQLQTTTFNLKLIDIPKSQAILAIETVLALNNIGVAPQGDRFLIVTNLQLTPRNAPEMITGSSFDQPPSGKIAVKVFQLQFIPVQFFTQILQNITTQGLGQALVPLQSSNAVMVTETVSNLQRIEALVQQLDKPATTGLKASFKQLRNGAKASDVVQKIRTMLPPSMLGQLQATTFTADDRTNQIVVMTDPAQFPFFDELIDKLDAIAAPNTQNAVIPLKHATAQKLNDVLSYIIKGQVSAQQRQQNQVQRPGQINLPTNQLQPIVPGAATPPIPGPNAAIAAAALESAGPGSAEFSQAVTTYFDERSNAIIVSGTADDIRLVTSLIDKLDTVLAQVRIEVVIAEVTLDDSHSSGISQLGLQLDGDRLVGINGSAVGVGVGGSTDGSFATISRLGGPGSLARSLDLTGVFSIGSTPRKNQTTVLSTPSITTSHAIEGMVISSEKRSVTTGTTSAPSTGSSGFQNQQNYAQQDIGITLKVTPLIGADGSVQLKIDQDVQDVSGTQIINGTENPIISHRQTTTTISAKSGDIMVLSGMQRIKDTRQTSRLGPIPIIGDILGTRTKGVTRTELLFFVRPYVLTNTPADNAEALKRIEGLPDGEVRGKEDIQRAINPNYVPKQKGVLDKILPK